MIVMLIVLVALLMLGISTPVALGASSLLYLLLLSDFPSTTMLMTLLGAQVQNVFQSYLLMGIALFLFYGRLCGAMNVRGRFASSFAALFGERRLAATVGEIIASVIQPDTAGDALLQRNDDAAATVNRLRRAGTAGWSAIGQAGALACLRVIMPPGIALLIVSDVFDQSTFVSFGDFTVLALVLAVILFLLAIPGAGEPAVADRATGRVDWSAFPWLLAPIVILGSIFAGLFTPSEAAGLAVVVALLLGAALGQISGRILLRAMLDTLYDIGAIFLVVVFASIFVFATGWDAADSDFLTWTSELGLVLPLIMALMIALLASALTGLLVTLLVIAPICILMASSAGVDPETFASAFLLAATLGLVVPPTGAVFATLAAGTTERLYQVMYGMGIFALGLLAILILSLML